MAIVDIKGNELAVACDIYGNELTSAYNFNGEEIYSAVEKVGYKYGTAYKFSEMEIADTDGISVVSSEHTRNDSSTYHITPTAELPSGGATVLSNYQCVEFTCNIPTKGENVGLWIWMDRFSKGVYGGNSKTGSQIIMQIQINNTKKMYMPATSGASLKSGMNYYYFKNSEVGETIKSIKIYVVKLGSVGGSIYLDSLEVGFRMHTPHILFNLDCSPNNFYEVGYPLFKSYGLKATLDYHISSTDSTVGALSDTLINNAEAQRRHWEIINDGFDYGAYSGWKEIEGTRPYYDDEDSYNTWLLHAQRMFGVNNNGGIYAPSTVHSSGFISGETYEKAMVDAGFLIVRTDNVASEHAEFVYYDKEDYREIMPYFIWNVWDADADAITNLKARIDDCVATGRNLMIGFHQIMPTDYEPSSNDMNIGYNAVNELLSYVKSYVDKGKLKCSTTSEFVQEVEPELYEKWYEERSKSVQI